MPERNMSIENKFYKSTPEQIKSLVKEKYSLVATNPEGKFNFPVGRKFAESVGYPAQLLDKLPVSLWESFTGAGNPQPFIDIKAGEKVLDLGCGAGLDIYLYAQVVGLAGKVYAVDISEEMISKARSNMHMLGIQNVEFFCACADNIPLPNDSIDIITANGIYNLSPDKDAVMREAARLLRRGGRTIFAEIILTSPLPKKIRQNAEDWFRCIGGALTQDDLFRRLELAGFSSPQILWSGRNARTGHKLALCALIRAEKR